MTMTTAEILEKAAEYIEENGWVQGGGGTGLHNELCVGLALATCCLGTEVTSKDFCPPLGFDNTGELIAWNDDPSRTKEEVCRMLRTVAAKLDARSGAQEPLYGPPSINLDSDVISALVEHTEAYSVDRDYGDENWHVRNYEPVES